MPFGQIRTSSGRVLNYSPEGWITPSGYNLNADQNTGRLSQLVSQQMQGQEGPMNDQSLSALVNTWNQSTAQPQQDLSSFLAANNTSMRNQVDYMGKKAFLTPDGSIVWQLPGGGTGKATIQNKEQDIFNAAKRKAQQEELDIQLKQKELQTPVEKTPVLSDIVDPNDPTRMLRINARAYTGGSIGSPGVIGSSGKEPRAALEADRKAIGRQAFSDELDNIQGLYNQLNSMKGMTSTDRSTLSNLASSAQSSGVGQMLGKAIGSEEQRIRDEIASSRMRLMQAVKAATGMSSQQLNSNVELQTMLSSLGDPSKTYEANTGIIDQMRARYGAEPTGNTQNNPVSRQISSSDYQETLFNARKAIARNPAAREAILQKMKAAGYDTRGL